MTAQAQMRKNIGDLGYRLSTGQMGKLYTDIAPQSRSFQALRDEISENTQTIDNIQISLGRLNVIELNIRTMMNTLTDFRVRLNQALNPVSVDPGFNTFCGDTLNFLEKNLNQNDFEERNLFGGQKTFGHVCDVSRLPNFFLGQPFTYDYALGNDQKFSLNIDEESPCPYGSTLYEPGIAKTLQCFKIGKENLPGTDRTTQPMQLLESCVTLSTEALGDLSELLNRINSQRHKFTTLKETLEQNNLFLSENLSQITDADLVQTYVELVTQQEGLNISLHGLKKTVLGNDLLNLLN